MTPSFHSAPLSWVITEVDNSFQYVKEQLVELQRDPGDATLLRNVQHALHEASGAISIVGLDGAARICAEAEAYVTHVLAADDRSSNQAILLISSTINALTSYLHGLLAGKPVVLLDLFPLYARIRAGRNGTPASEADLFFPDLSTPLPPLPPLNEAEADPASSSTIARQARANYELGLVEWLQEGQSAGLQKVHESLCTIEQLGGAHRLTWWTAIAFFELILQDGLATRVDLRQMVGRINLQLRKLSLAGQGQRPSESLLRDLLYHIARGKPVSERIRQTQQIFGLAALLPTPVTDADLGDRRRLAQHTASDFVASSKSQWLAYVTGAGHSLKALLIDFEGLLASVQEIGHPALLELATDLYAIVRTCDPVVPPATGACQEMAVCLVLLEEALIYLDDLSEVFPQLARQATARVRRALAGETLPAIHFAASLLTDQGEQRRETQLYAHLRRLLRAEIKVAESILDHYFRDPSHAGDLLQVSRILASCASVMQLCTMPQEAALLHALAADLPLVAANTPVPDSRMHAWASTLGEVDLRLQGLDPAPILQDKPAPSTSAMAEPPADLVAPPDPWPPAAVVDVPDQADPEDDHAAGVLSPADPGSVPASGTDPVQEAFREEATEILGWLERALAEQAAAPGNLQHLGFVQKALATLGNSARLAERADLGELAEAVAALLVEWIGGQRPADAPLLQLLQAVHAELIQRLDDGPAGSTNAWEAWLEPLRAQLRAPGSLKSPGAAADDREVAGGKTLPPHAEPEAGTGHGPEEVPDADKPLRIGDLEVDRELFALFQEEVRDNLASLHAQYHGLSGSGGSVSYDFMRAAHTLAGIARTVGMDQLGRMARALEEWLHVLRDNNRTVQDGERTLLARTLGALEAMLQEIATGSLPVAHADLLADLARARAAGANRIAAASPDEPADVFPDPAPAPAPLPAAAGSEVTVGSALPRVATGEEDSLQQDLLPTFLEEIAELYPLLCRQIRDWSLAPLDAECANAVKRSLHTLKGSARMAGAMKLGALAHELEHSVGVASEEMNVAPEFFQILEARLDAVQIWMESLPAAPAPAQPPGHASPGLGNPAPAEMPARKGNTVLRVPVDVADSLANDAGEISIARSRLHSDLSGIRMAITDLSDYVGRMRAQLREIEIQADSQIQSQMNVDPDYRNGFDPLELDRYSRLQELTRMMAETLNDAVSLHSNILRGIESAENSLLQQNRMIKDLQSLLMSIRMVRFAEITDRFRRTVRLAAGENHKQVNLHISGEEVEIDRSVLERMLAPFEHLLRNAVLHGLEGPEERTARGKPAAGVIRITARQDRNEIVFTIADDGAGINSAKVHQKAREKGLLPPDHAVPEARWAELIYLPGLSTADTVTQEKGRGIGMDVVKREITELGGRIELASQAGEGTTFTIYLPLTLATMQVVVIRSGNETYALPGVMVEQVQIHGRERLQEIYQEGHISWMGQDYPLYYLEQLVGNDVSSVSLQSLNTVILLAGGQGLVAVHVDEILGNHEVVLKNLGPQLQQVPGLAGVTVLANGREVVILNPVSLARTLSAAGILPGTGSSVTVLPVALADQRANPPLILIVDDSLTVRKVTSKLLAREGYELLIAKDGADALEQLDKQLPDLMLVDIEMPRMDGFELVKHLKTRAETAGIPVIMITSRTAEKHHNHAVELGVSAYMGKPYQDEILLDTIRRLLHRHS